jgi:hypothetical protein
MTEEYMYVFMFVQQDDGHSEFSWKYVIDMATLNVYIIFPQKIQLHVDTKPTGSL